MDSTVDLTSVTDANLFVPSIIAQNVDQLFLRYMYDNLREGVILVDRHCNITLWNQAAEQLTGLRSVSMLDQKWAPSQVDLRDRFENKISDSACPVGKALQTGVEDLVAGTVAGPSGHRFSIDLSVVPVLGHNTDLFGAVIYLRDLSSQLDLEQQVLTLYAHATRDQLTGVANRAHFERSLDVRLKEFHESGSPCSLIVADIDYFKKINDEFGHHAGDQALTSFAKILQENTRTDDLVARYGGEEFVIICPNCHTSDAVNIAEQVRASLEQTPMAILQGRCVHASFGVSEFQAGDTATLTFIRADQALLNSKENGRNQVQSLQTLDEPMEEAEQGEEELQGELGWKKLKGPLLWQEETETTTPPELLFEKIKGYVIDLEAEIVIAEPGHVRFRIERTPGVKLKRFTDRHTPMMLDIEMREDAPPMAVDSTDTNCIRLRFTLRTVKTRDRRHRELEGRVKALILDLRAHLGVSFENEDLRNVEEADS